MIVYRISDCNFVKDLSGKGSSLYGGRWNSRDIYAVYTAQSRSLALLEVVVHVGKVPKEGYCIATIEIPDHSIQRVPLETLPAGWHSNPPPNYLKSIGDNFIKSNKHLVLEIPSVLMMEEHSYMLNPSHYLFNKVKIISERPLRMDERLFPKPVPE
jgi:RES domain-containing protein